MDYSPPGSSVHGILHPGKSTGVVCHALLQGNLLQGIFDPGIKAGSPALQADSLPSEAPGKSKTWKLDAGEGSGPWAQAPPLL